MRYVIVAAIALVIGFVAGSLGPRADLREAKSQVADLQKKLEEKPKGLGLMSQLALNRAGRRGGSDDFFGDRPEVKADAPKAEVAEAIPEGEDDDDEPSEGKSESLKGDVDRLDLASEENLERARTAMEMRRAQSRAALMEQVDLNDDELAAFDDAVNQMNDDLELFVEDAASFLKEDRQPSRREAMEFAAGVLDVVLAADERIEGAIGEGKYGEADEDAVDPISYLDPALIDLFQEL